jgi:hypothetical protein
MAEPSDNKRKTRSRFVRDASYDKPLAVTERDLDILRVVADYRLLTAPQIARLFFSSLAKCRKRLFRLWQHKLLDRRFQPVRQNEGAAPILYTLSRQGARYLASKSGFSGEAPPYTPFVGRGSLLFIEHTLRRNDFRVALTLACRQGSNTRLLWWRQDNGIKDTVTFVDKDAKQVFRRVSVLADGFFGIEHQGKRLFYFVEVDRATVSSQRMLLRFRGYYHMWLQKRQVKRFEIPSFRVLIATSSQARMRKLVETARQVSSAPEAAKLFWFSTFEHYGKPNSILEPIWQSASQEATRMCLLGSPALTPPTPADAGQQASAPT